MSRHEYAPRGTETEFRNEINFYPLMYVGRFPPASAEFNPTTPYYIKTQPIPYGTANQRWGNRLTVPSFPERFRYYARPSTKVYASDRK